MKVVLDMNLSALFAEWLRAQGWEARRWHELGPPATEDSAILDWCARNDACLVTQDGDFALLLFQTQAAKPSVLHLRDCDPMDPALWQRIHKLLLDERRDIQTGCLLVMNPRRTRMRRLPLCPGDGPPLPGEITIPLN